MAIKTYDPKLVLVSFMGFPLTGFATDTFIEVDYDEDAYSKKIGADGEGARARNRNKGGKVTLTLMQSSAANDVLSGLAVADRDFGLGVGPLMVKELGGTTLVLAGNAWIQKMPTVAFGKENGERSWVFDTTDLAVVVGGNS